MPGECANPLFLSWLEELRDSARANGLKTADTYAKACRSLSACPVSYTHPRELAILQGIGPKTVATLEKRLREHCKETGEAYPVSPKRRKQGGKDGDKENEMETAEGEKDTETEERPAKKKRAPRPPRAYIPQHGSGAYGILLGLLSHLPEGSVQSFLTKGELVRAAQPFCTSSYDHAERGTFVTAWAGMKTLVNRGYVVVQGSPHRYSLTEDGHDVAVTLMNMRENEPQRAAGRHASEPPVRASSATPIPSAPPVAPQAAGGLKFEFWYIDALGARVHELTAARLRLCPDEYVSLRRIEFRTVQRSHPIVGTLRMLEESGTSVFAYIAEEGAPPRCSCFAEEAAQVALPSRTFGRSSSASTLVLGSASLAASRMASRAAPSRLASVVPSPVAGPSRLGSVAASPVAGPSRAPSVSSLAPDSPGLAPRPAPRAPLPAAPRGPRLSSQLPLLGEERDAPLFDQSDALIFPEGSYDVVLILDTREVESRSSRDKIAESLAARGITVETRALRLGDMCWVARRRDGLGDEEDECVLDYVVERKRLDDLCSSIRDGRYQEQCFRLSQSCIRNVFYVVEDWQTAARMEVHGKQIMTAKSQIQVINGFFLKETHKLSDTIDFLATMTRVIASTHKDLHVIPSRHLSRTSYTSLQGALRRNYPSTSYLTSFDAYQALNDKSAARTLRESFGRMLLCIRGMSAERVAAVLDRWDTPRSLYDAMVERHKLGTVGTGARARPPSHFFAEEIEGEGRRKIGPALSRDLWKCLWGEE